MERAQTSPRLQRWPPLLQGTLTFQGWRVLDCLSLSSFDKLVPLQLLRALECNYSGAQEPSTRNTRALCSTFWFFALQLSPKTSVVFLEWKKQTQWLLKKTRRLLSGLLSKKWALECFPLIDVPHLRRARPQERVYIHILLPGQQKWEQNITKHISTYTQGAISGMNCVTHFQTCCLKREEPLLNSLALGFFPGD